MKKVFFSFILTSIVFVSFFQTAFALTVSPARVEVSGDPGAFVNGEIVLFNNELEEKKYFISSENFEPRGDSGAPYFIGANGGLATWISVQGTEVVIPPQSEVSVPYTIRIPSSATPGGYFAAIFFGTQPPSGSADGGDVAVGGKIGVLILLRVNGDIEEGGGLVSFETIEGKKFFTQTPILMQYRFNNTGGDRVVPRGSVFVKNIFGSTVEEIKANVNEGSVLPGSMRRFEMVWGDIAGVTQVAEGESIDKKNFFQHVTSQWNNFHFGRYRVELDIVWGQSGTQTAKDHFFIYIIPWQLLVIIFGILALIILSFKRFLKKYNQMILRNAGVYSPESVSQHVGHISRENSQTDARAYTRRPQPTTVRPSKKRVILEQEVTHKKIDAIKPRRKI